MKTARGVAIQFHKTYFPDTDCDSNCRTIQTLEPILRQWGEQIREEAAKVAEHPYSDEVNALGPNEPQEVGDKIARAIRSIEI